MAVCLCGEDANPDSRSTRFQGPTVTSPQLPEGCHEHASLSFCQAHSPPSAAGGASAASPAGKASTPAAPPETLFTRDTLTEDWFGIGGPLATRGIGFDLSTTGYYAGLLSGTGDEDFEWGGRADAFLKLDTGKLGLWNGGGFKSTGNPGSGIPPKRSCRAPVASGRPTPACSSHSEPPGTWSLRRSTTAIVSPPPPQS